MHRLWRALFNAVKLHYLFITYLLITSASDSCDNDNSLVHNTDEVTQRV